MLSRKEKDAIYYKNNRERKLAYQKAYADARKEHISKVKAEYYKRTKEIKKAYVSKYRKENPHKVNALNRKHQADKIKRTPKWLTTLHLSQIEMFYDAAQKLTKEFGIPMEVDHIVPIKGRNVSGLHVPWNLQVISKSANGSKHNKYENR